MKKFCIVIPIYKETLDCIEQISLRCLWSNIKDKEYSVYFVLPEGMDTSEYYNCLDTVKATKYFKELYFDPEYFKSTATYSQLCLSFDFYNKFSDFEYMYIYQLDCYLFKDEFEKWADKGYDYIGGPILSTDCGWTTVKKRQGKNKWQPYVGNGGFSLRKISTFKELTDPNGEFRTYYKLTAEHLKAVKYEDKYFCNDIYDFYELNIPNWVEAMQCCLDMSVDIVYNYFKVDPKPMAIHSWDKNIRWWKKVIPELIGNDEVINYCEKKHEDFFKLYYDENDSTLRQ